MDIVYNRFDPCSKHMSYNIYFHKYLSIAGNCRISLVESKKSFNFIVFPILNAELKSF